MFSNHKSANAHEKFVGGEISELLQGGSAKGVESWKRKVFSPLGVAKGKKLRLILDLCYVKRHLSPFPFKCDSPDCLVNMYKWKDWIKDWIIQFDLKSAYHHITTMLTCGRPTQSTQVLTGKGRPMFFAHYTLCCPQRLIVSIKLRGFSCLFG